MLAIPDRVIPRLYSQESVALLIVFSCLAFLVSPLSPFGRKLQDKIVIIFPPAIFVYWYLFQFELMSFDPTRHFYLSPNGVFLWTTNSSICYGFGAAFSVRLFRIRSLPARIEGAFFLFIYCGLILSRIRPALQTT